MAQFLATGCSAARYPVTEFPSVGLREAGFSEDETEAWLHFDYRVTAGCARPCKNHYYTLYFWGTRDQGDNHLNVLAS